MALSLRLMCALLVAMSLTATVIYQGDEPTKNDSLNAMRVANVHPDELGLIAANLEQITMEQLESVRDFLIASDAIAPSHFYNVSRYADWNAYNFVQPETERALGVLGRRDLFMDPARQLNDRALTNMTPEALAALVFSQTYVEEMWDQVPPWDGDPNPTFNWVHSDLLARPSLSRFVFGDFIYRERTRYAVSLKFPALMFASSVIGLSNGTDLQAALRDTIPPAANAPRLVGHSYPIGNQLFTGTAESAYWYFDYLAVASTRYGSNPSRALDLTFEIPPEAATDIYGVSDDPATRIIKLFQAEYTRQIWRELTHPERAAFWNVMRFLHAGARQREGGGSAAFPGNNQSTLFALRYDDRSETPVGRPQAEVSAFSLITTVYSDSILLDFTNWNVASQTLVVSPLDATRTDGIHRLVSERNKAVRVIEHMGSELSYPNATHVSGSRGLGFSLTPFFGNVMDGDFLPYTFAEADALVRSLRIEAVDYGVAASQETLCQSPMLRASYEFHHEEVSWTEATSGLCR